MRPLPLLAAVALLAILALRRRTLGRATGAAGVLVAALLAGYGFGLYTLPSIDDSLTRLAPMLGNWTYPLVGLLAYLESAAFVGLVAPGELTVVLGGRVARDGAISIELLFVIVWLSAVAGDSTGFMLGRKLGRAFLFEHGPRFHITPQIVARVEGIFDRHGGKAIILGRFIGVARAITPFLAGSSHLSFRRFLAFDISAPPPGRLPSSRSATSSRRAPPSRVAVARGRSRHRHGRRRRSARARHPPCHP